MRLRAYLFLALLGIIVLSLVAVFQSSPGYMDADYYYAEGLQLASGKGFTEPFIWNYLDNPVGLPHPSHSYWMPLASIIATIGIFFLGHSSWFAARIGFILVASLLPPLTAALSWSFFARRDLAILSGLLAVFSAFYLPFLPVTDTFGIYMLLGGLFFLILNREPVPINSLAIGLIAGLMHLSRADGLIWLLVAFIAIFYILPKPANGKLRFTVSRCFLALCGYLLIMIPWFARNYSVFGTFLAPGASRMLWLTSYDQIFSYPANTVTFESWWQYGASAILRVRAWSLGLNLSSLLSVQGEVFVFPLTLAGIWFLRKDRRVQLAVITCMLTFALMTVVFPFAGARGGFFHSGASLQAIWWAVSPIGLDRVITWGGRNRSWKIDQARKIFGGALIAFAIMLSVVIVYLRVIQDGTWHQEQDAYRKISGILISFGMDDDAIIMVANPPGFFVASGNPAIAVPDGDVNSLISAGRRYGAAFLILEAGSVPSQLIQVYEHPNEQPHLKYLGVFEGTKLYELQP
jgi:hypothetical protein